MPQSPQQIVYAVHTAASVQKQYSSTATAVELGGGDDCIVPRTGSTDCCTGRSVAPVVIPVVDDHDTERARHTYCFCIPTALISLRPRCNTAAAAAAPGTWLQAHSSHHHRPAHSSALLPFWERSAALSCDMIILLRYITCSSSTGPIYSYDMYIVSFLCCPLIYTGT